VEPTIVTWNSLCRGYARMQDVPNTVRTVEQLEDEGWEVDSITMKALAWIKDRNALIRAMKLKVQRRDTVGADDGVILDPFTKDVERVVNMASELSMDGADGLRDYRPVLDQALRQQNLEVN